jgi:hypothetical protein
MQLFGNMFERSSSAPFSLGRYNQRGRHMTDSGLDEPVPDVLEQRREAVPGADAGDDAGLPDQLPFEADEADAAEQAREVELGEEDYR